MSSAERVKRMRKSRRQAREEQEFNEFVINTPFLARATDEEKCLAFQRKKEEEKKRKDAERKRKNSEKCRRFRQKSKEERQKLKPVKQALSDAERSKRYRQKKRAREAEQVRSNNRSSELEPQPAINNEEPVKHGNKAYSFVPCLWCKVKKRNFDMIERTDSNSQAQVFCSLNCLSLYRVSLNATSSKSTCCDNCCKNHPAQYHVIMSDGSIRNFCTYQCVIVFQNQFTNIPALKTTTRQTSSTVPAASNTETATSKPVISNVISLAPATRTVAPSTVNKLVPQKMVSALQPGPSVAVVTSKSQAPSSTSPASSTTSASTAPQQIVREIVVKSPAPKSVKTITVSCKPIMQSQAILRKPQPCHKAVQTDDSPRPVILPIPVPIYVLTPMHMFSRPVPCPVPFPVPVPVPIIFPTSKNSPSQVIKHLKDIQIAQCSTRHKL